MLFNSGNETFHVAARPKSIVYSSGSFSEQVIPNSQPDPFRFHRPEWLVWRLMESWGFDQIAAEVWMERNVIDDESGIRFREESLPDEGSEANCIRIRKEIEGKLSDMEFPAEFEQYLTSRDEMKA
ncbi:MAG: hypothetical protein JNM43_10260 [Planctomycetaceae bacterium]|nr:hypothetical protein [Planctomycetaceae bacterium]